MHILHRLSAILAVSKNADDRPVRKDADMNMKMLLPLLLLCSCAPVAATHAPSPAAASAAHKTAFPAVQAFADAMVASGRVPAISIAVAVGDEAPTFISAGHLTLDPASPAAAPDTLWRLYSMTKPVTGIAAMILVDEGKLRLDQPVSDFFPSFRESRVLVDPAKGLETRPASRPITIRDLMTHSSGLNYAINGAGPSIDALKKEGLVPYMFDAASEARLRPIRPQTLQAFAERAGQAGLIADPGTRFSYSMGLDVLAAVVERAAGMPFETFLDRRLIKPLHMTSTYWQVPGSEAGRFANNYVPKTFAAFFGFDATGVKDDFIAIDRGADSIYLNKASFPYGGAGLVSTARDYDRFLHMLLDGGRLGNVRILSERTAKLAMSNLLPNGVVLRNFGPVPRDEDTGMGAGGFVTTADVDGLGRHRGTFGWDGAAGTRAWTDPVRRVRATMMINAPGAANVGEEFDRAVATDLAAKAGRL